MSLTPDTLKTFLSSLTRKAIEEDLGKYHGWLGKLERGQLSFTPQVLEVLVPALQKRGYVVEPEVPDHVAKLRELSEGLLYTSEGDYPVEVVDRETTLLLLVEGLHYTLGKVNRFFKKQITDHPQAQRFSLLQSYIIENFPQAQVRRIYSKENPNQIIAVIMLQDKNGEYFSLKTTLNET